MCTSATIIGNGRLLASGRVDELIDSGPGTYAVTVPDAAAAGVALSSAGFVVSASPTGVRVESEDPAAITRTLADAGIWLTGLTAERRDLESVFLELTSADTLGHDTGEVA